jgi:signal transduction histidine kinase
MSTRTATRLAIALTILYVVLEAAGLAFQFATGVAENEVVGLSGRVVSGFVFLAWSAIGAVIASRHPGNAIGWVLSGIALVWAIEDLMFGYATYAIVSHPGSLPAGVFAALTYNNIFFIAELLLVLLFLLFPDGRALSPRWRAIGWVALLATAVMFLGSYVIAGPVEGFGIQNPYAILPGPEVFGWVTFFLLFGTVIASVVALVVRLRRARGDERQQLRWFVYAAAFLPVSFAFAFFGTNRTTDLISAALLIIAITGIPVAAGIAILKYRLYDIDVVIGKTVVVGVLAAFATIVYLGVVVGVGTLVGTQGGEPSILLAVVATAVVAVAFQPVRQWAQRLANRLVYGERATPYDVLSDFADRLADNFATQDLLPRMAKMLAEGTGAARADVWLRVGDDLRPAGSWPAEAAPLPPRPISADGLPFAGDVDLAVPVRHQHELLGAVTISKKAGEHATPMEEKLVADLAAQAGLVLSNARLIEELLASRQRLVAAQDEQRRKLERNLHDGAQQQLVALAVKQRLAETLIDRDPGRARVMLTEIQADTVDALETLRDLARGIYPPLLADKGLAAALLAQIRKAAIPVELHTDGVERYPQEVEAAAYFCCLEALQNVAKYAAAARVSVRLSAGDGRLTFVVEDDGVGFDPARVPRGTGLQGMSDRLEALGGELEILARPHAGTIITGRIPTRALVPNK